LTGPRDQPGAVFMGLILQGAMAVAALVLVAALWHAGQARSLFVVRLARGEPRAAAGTVTRAFLAEVRAIATRHGVTRGRIAGVEQGTDIRLVFSRHFPPVSRQQLRNWWGIHGWRAGKPPRSDPPFRHSRA
jgi:hypothetical protein